MRILLASLVLVLTTLFSSAELPVGSSFTNTPVLTVDYWHWMSREGAGSNSHSYRVAPSPAVILDAANFHFVPPERLKDQPPNLVCVTVDDGDFYVSKLKPGEKRIELSARTLPKGDSRVPFAGFVKPLACVVNIGILETNGTYNEEWVTMIEIQ